MSAGDGPTRSDSKLRLAARMSSIERAGPWEVPREVEVRAWWGNVELDLREATLRPGETTLDVRATMSNIEVIVPPHVEVRMDVASFASSVEEDSIARASARASADGSAGTSDVAESPYRDPAKPASSVLRIVGRVRFANLEVIRLWPGEPREPGHRRRHHHRHGRAGHGWRDRSRWEDACDPFDVDPIRKSDLDSNSDGAGRDGAGRDGAMADREGGDRAISREERWRLARERRRAHREERRRRWRELHDERDMWRRSRARGQPWMPWWMMARMRRRIFLWLAVALGGGIAIGLRVSEQPRWWWVAIGLVGLFVVSGFIAFRLTRPLIMVVKAAREIGDGKLDTRLDVERHGGETRVLAIAINDMAEKIEQQLADQRQLLAAVSHELRTPLGHMRVLVETARGEPVSSAAAAGSRDQAPNLETPNLKALDEIEREILVLDDLVGKLLASSRLEFGNLERRPLDLGELVSDAATAAGVAPEAIEAIGDVRAAIDPTLIKRALANLLDNARNHGKGVIAVRIERRAGQVAIEVDDAGPGVSAERRAEAFRAFGPSSGTAGGGSGLGLGLALVSRIAVAHGGGAWIVDRPGGGARVGFAVQA